MAKFYGWAKEVHEQVKHSWWYRRERLYGWLYRYATQHLQNSPLNQWVWVAWRDNDTGYIVLLPFWERPNKLWYTKYKLE